jgi:hypothetical protein
MHGGLLIQKSEVPLKSSIPKPWLHQERKIYSMKKENCGRRVAIASGLACPNCRRAIRHYDVEWISESTIRVNCQGCHRPLIELEG